MIVETLPAGTPGESAENGRSVLMMTGQKGRYVMLNQVAIHGRLAADPEVRKTGNKKSVLNFAVAVDRDYTDDEGERGVDFLDVVAWGSVADFVEKYFKKGDLIVVTGSLQKRVWEDEDEQKHYVTEIVAQKIYFGGQKRSDETKEDKNTEKTKKR